jgi:hypothetical protein
MTTMPKRKKYDEKLFIDLPFGEALERYIGVKPAELQANLDKLKKRKKAPGGRGVPTPSGGQDLKSQKVVRLRDRRKPKNG